MLHVHDLQLIYYSRDDISIYHTCQNCPVGEEIHPNLRSTSYFTPYFGSTKCTKCAELEATNDGSSVVPTATPPEQVTAHS